MRQFNFLLSLQNFNYFSFFLPEKGSDHKLTCSIPNTTLTCLPACPLAHSCPRTMDFLLSAPREGNSPPHSLNKEQHLAILPILFHVRKFLFMESLHEHKVVSSFPILKKRCPFTSLSSPDSAPFLCSPFQQSSSKRCLHLVSLLFQSLWSDKNPLQDLKIGI